MLKEQAAGALIGDRGYDTNALRTLLADRNLQAVIPTKSNWLVQIPHDKEIYKECNRISTRFDRNDSHFLAFLHLAASLLWLI